MAESVRQNPSKSLKLLVAAIDFGTTYSGYAYSWKHEWTEVKTNKWAGGSGLSYKTPSVLLLNEDKSFNSFGYDAEKKYSSLVENGTTCKKYFYFHRFKMILKKPLEKVMHYIGSLIILVYRSIDRGMLLNIFLFLKMILKKYGVGSFLPPLINKPFCILTVCILIDNPLKTNVYVYFNAIKPILFIRKRN